MRIKNELRRFTKKYKLFLNSFLNRFFNQRPDSKYFLQKIIGGNYLPAHDKSFSKWIDRNGDYQIKPISEAIALDNSERDFAIDIGANVGLISRVLCKKYKYVVAFEPSSQNRSAIYRNLDPKQNNLIIYPFALSSKNEYGKIGISKINCGNNSLCEKDLKNPDYFERVNLMKLDDLLIGNTFFEKRRLSLIKIDIQGYEIFALKGAKNTIAKHKPIILCEVISESGNNEIIIKNFLKDLGYKLKVTFKKDRIYKCE